MWQGLGAIHKGRPHPRGEGGLVKSGHMRTQGGGGVIGKMRTSSKFKVYLVYCVLKDNIRLSN